MAEYRITASSTCDLTGRRLKKMGVLYGRYHYNLDGQDFEDDFFETISAKDFYTRLENGSVSVTSQVTIEDLMGIFDFVLSKGEDVLHIEFSSGLSGGYQSAIAAAGEMRKKYPDRKIYVVDSLCASSGYGLLVDKAVELKKTGTDIDALYAWLEENKLRVRHWFFTPNLSYLKRGGRVSPTAATLGTIMHICPVMDVSCEGKLVVRKKVMGRKLAMRELFRMMCEEAEGGEDYSGKVFICNAQKRDAAKELATMVEKRFTSMKGRPAVFEIGTVIGSHTGPGVISLFFFGETKRDK
ncbi:MAG: DegV family protein [Clostridia bacterium]|nr:DegV family protein [Clostridia bacterium]